jgi:hypothetical protein
VISVKIPTCTSFNESLTGGSTTSVFFLDKSNGSFKNAKKPVWLNVKILQLKSPRKKMRI